jgi:EpsI family protein
MTRQLQVRLVIVLAVLLAARFAAAGRTPVITPLHQPLATFPLHLEQWHGRNGPSFDANTLRVLGADDYVNRIYLHPTHGYVGLYVGYYGAQTQGDAIHSPQNCLPGSGWVPISRARVTLQTPDGDFAVNRYIVEKRGDRQVVLYWFEGRGRRVASEYLNKAYLLRDALRLGRTEGALVRIIAPVPDGDGAADASARAFARALVPQLRRWLP